MLKKIILFMFILVLVVGCGSKDTASDSKKGEKGEYTSFTIKTNLTNKDYQPHSYDMYLLTPGLLPTEVGQAMNDSKYGPIEVDENGEVKIELSWNNSLIPYIENPQNTKKNHLQLVIATKEDIYLRNPLNKPTYIEFVKNKNAEPYDEFEYYAAYEKIEVDITDKYPDGVLSLTFQDATFVIRLEFEEGFEPASSYVVAIYKPDTNGSDIGMYNLGRIARKFQYWDTPFYKTDNLKAWGGTIVVKDYSTDSIINYEGYPKKVTFNEEGKCEQGDIVRIKIKK